jgi:hypothetical protein
MHHVGTYCRDMGILHFFFQILANLGPKFPQKPFVCTKIISSKKMQTLTHKKTLLLTNQQPNGGVTMCLLFPYIVLFGVLILQNHIKHFFLVPHVLCVMKFQ